MDGLLDYGYIGLFIGAMLAATIIPFSSEFLLVGILAADGNAVTTVVVATLGNTLGGMISYLMGYWGKWEWIEKWFRVKPETLEKQKKKIDKYGAYIALLSWLPLVGDVFAMALGFYKINPKLTLLFMFIGKGLRFIAGTLAFYYIKEQF